MKTIENDALIRQLRWRYATKKFDPQRKITPRDWQTLEETLVLAPSSFGLQPWRFLVVDNPQMREQLVAASWNQRQVADASHLVVFAIKRDLGAADIERHLQRITEVRGVRLESLAAFRSMMMGTLVPPPPGFDVNDWAARQVYIALGNFMMAAALLGIDTCPLEGIEPAKYDELLGLAGSGYATQVAATAGYRANDDAYAQQPKVRYDIADVVRRVR
ncbi:MAG TPA: NAD(P)H-dependent oxidoreductase [Phycisphaerae bacterium]|nr:NAD(P)H-dependent oxidoreductase [Phycisphaerales bacterium]HRX83625.1 NAD(P)H-dependent oxidoreductase [Phycisphaerae bacterium]